MSIFGAPLTNEIIERIARFGLTEAMEYILTLDIDPDILNSALPLTALNGHVDTVKLLLSDRRINKHNEKALIYAVEAGHIDVVNVLLQNNAPSQDELDILFVLAAKKGDYNIAKTLLKYNLYSPTDDVIRAFKANRWYDLLSIAH